MVEGEEVGLGPVQFGGHHRLIEIHGEKYQDTVVQPERWFLGVTVKHPLPLGIVHALAGELVLQLDGHHWDAVHRQHHVHAVVVLPRVVPLADTLADVLAIVLDGHIV